MYTGFGRQGSLNRQASQHLVGSSRPASGTLPADGAISGMPLPRAPSLPVSRQGSGRLH